jgi:hypothetical protein
MSTISFERPEHYVAAARELRSRAVMEAFTGCTFALLLAVFAAHWRRLLVHVHDTERKKSVLPTAPLRVVPLRLVPARGVPVRMAR